MDLMMMPTTPPESTTFKDVLIRRRNMRVAQSVHWRSASESTPIRTSAAVSAVSVNKP